MSYITCGVTWIVSVTEEMADGGMGRHHHRVHPTAAGGDG